MSVERTPLNAITQFANGNRDKRIGVVLSTAMILDTSANIRKLSAMSNIRFFLPDNCFCEWKLLSEWGSKPAIREKAKLMIHQFENARVWPMQMIYDHQNEFVMKCPCDVLLFVFCEPAVAEEFSTKFTSTKKRCYIISINPYSIDGKDNVICGNVGCAIKRISKPLNNTVSFSAKHDNLTVRDRDGRVICPLKRENLEDCILGGEAEVYSSSLLPGKLIKLYSEWLPGENTVNKLKILINYKDWTVGSFPVYLVYNEKNDCVGFVMEKFDGKNLYKALNSNNMFTTASEKYMLIKKVSAVLLECRITQLVVADLSLNNIFVATDGSIHLIDCDSMDAYNYPGAGVTPPFGHPDVTQEYFYKKLRTHEQSNFSFAVLMFCILLGWDNPLSQGGVNKPEWRVHSFPLTNSVLTGEGCAKPGVVISNDKLSRWKSLPKDVRTGFINVFNFKNTYDIGSWMLMMKNLINL